MQRIKKIRMALTVQAGTNKWDQGTIIDAEVDGPIDPVLVQEVRFKTGTVEVLAWESDPMPSKPNPSKASVALPRKILKRG